MRPRWSGLISGIVSGTSAANRSFEEFEETTYPASRNAGSTSAATPEGSEEKRSSTSASAMPAGVVSATSISATSVGIGVSRRHFAASR